MRATKLLINFLDKDGTGFTTILRYVNPAADDTKLAHFVASLNNLTTNTVGEVFKIINKFLSEEAEYTPTKQDTDFIFTDDDFTFQSFTQNDIDYIFKNDNLNFDGFTQSDIDDIFS